MNTTVVMPPSYNRSHYGFCSSVSPSNRPPVRSSRTTS